MLGIQTARTILFPAPAPDEYLEPDGLEVLNDLYVGAKYIVWSYWRNDWVVGTIEFVDASPYLGDDQYRAYWVADDLSSTEYLTVDELTGID